MVNGKGLPFGGKGISWLRISARDGIEIYLDDYDVVLSTPLDDWKEGLARIGKVWQDLQRRKEVAQIKSVRAAGSKVLVYKKA
jgi:cell division septal protein FtsQ